MSRRTLIAVLSLALLAGACGEDEEGGGTQQYENAQFGFTLDHPESWTENQRAGVVVLLVNQESTQDGFAESVNVVSEDLPGEIPLDEYTEATIRNLEEGFGDIEVIEEGPTTIDDLPAHSIEYRAVQEGQTLSFLQTWFIDGTTAFVLTYTGHEQGFDDHRSEAEAIMESFRLT